MSDDPSVHNPLDLTGDAGGEAELTREDFDFIRTEATRILTDAAGSVHPRRAAFEDALYCRWQGQSFDGRKHRVDLNREAFPFEGSSDMRVRLADFVVRLGVQRLSTALERMNIRCVAGSDATLSGALEALLRNLMGEDLAMVWRREWQRVLQYAHGDTPGGAVMGVFWENRYTLVQKTLDGDALLSATITEYAPQGDPAFVQTLLYGEDDKAALDFLAVLAPGAKTPALRKALKALRVGESYTLSVPEMLPGRPVLRARRLFRDIYFPAYTTDLQRARVIYEREWLTVAELKGRIVTHGYDEAMVEEAMKHQGISFLPLADLQSLGYTEGVRWQGMPSTEGRRGQVEVITAYYRAANDDGASCVYMLPFSGMCEEPFTARTPLEYAHGEYPFVWYGREFLGESLWDTRGAPELVSTDQFGLKLLTDSFNDNTTLATIPPRKLPAERPDYRWALTPGAEVRVRRGEDTGFMTVPFPQSNLPMQESIMKRVGAYHGIPGFCDPEQLVTIAQSEADDFLPSVREVMRQMLSLALQYLPPEELDAKSGDTTGVLRSVSADAFGEAGYDLRLSFDARLGSVEWVQRFGDIVTKILALDMKGEADRNFILRKLFGALGPDWAPAVKQADAVNRDEIREETGNCNSIMNGYEPPMYPAGQNAQLRLNVIQDYINPQRNPYMAQRLAGMPDSQAMFQRRIEHFQGLVQQQQNAITGRNQAEYALPGTAQSAAMQ